jgi:hypothetical protein
VKTLAQVDSKEEILRRLKMMRPDSTRRWGRMTAPQAICHLSDAFRMAIGEKTVSPVSGLLQRTIIKWIALYTPLPWPEGRIATVPEIDQECGGTTPADFAADVAELETLVQLIASRNQTFGWPAHPIFGRMSHATWLRWAYLHMDHHLRQFGC